MSFLEEPARRTRREPAYDVIVAGGGTAGIIAAIAAARNGARTLLLERGGFLGGHIATQLLEHSVGWFDADGNPIVGGLANDLVDRLVAENASPGHVRDDTGYTKKRLPVEHELFKSVVTNWIVDEGVDFRVFAPAVAVVTAEGTAHVIAETKSGRLAFPGKALVDTTGDADICALADCGFLSEPGDQTQPVSLLFKLGGVDFERMLDYVEAHRDEFKIGVDVAQMRGMAFVNLWGFGAQLRQGFARHMVSLERNEMHVAGHVRTGEAVVNVTRYAADATDAASLSKAEAVLRRQVLEFVPFFQKLVPGCENAFLSATANCAGVRESRRIRGRGILRDSDVRSGRSFADAIARGGFPIDSHDAKGASMDGAEHVPSGYDIPFGALLPDRGPNIVVAGRCISAERKALASARITGTCMAMGQAAGTAAALSALSNVPLAALDVARLQAELLAQGAIFNGRSNGDTPARTSISSVEVE